MRSCLVIHLISLNRCWLTWLRLASICIYRSNGIAVYASIGKHIIVCCAAHSRGINLNTISIYVVANWLLLCIGCAIKLNRYIEVAIDTRYRCRIPFLTISREHIALAYNSLVAIDTKWLYSSIVHKLQTKEILMTRLYTNVIFYWNLGHSTVVHQFALICLLVYCLAILLDKYSNIVYRIYYLYRYSRHTLVAICHKVGCIPLCSSIEHTTIGKSKVIFMASICPRHGSGICRTSER